MLEAAPLSDLLRIWRDQVQEKLTGAAQRQPFSAGWRGCGFPGVSHSLLSSSTVRLKGRPAGSKASHPSSLGDPSRTVHFGYPGTWVLYSPGLRAALMKSQWCQLFCVLLPGPSARGPLAAHRNALDPPPGRVGWMSGRSLEVGGWAAL